MIQHRKQSNSLNNMGRGKSLRKFGTNITNMQIFHHAKHVSDYGSVLMEQQDGKRGGILRNNYFTEVMQVEKKIYDPISYHFEDIKHYITEQATYYAMQEDYMRWHSQINEEMREALVRWLIRIQDQLRLKQGTLYLGVKLADYYCYKKSISKNKYELLGICCLFMASKYEQITTPRMNTYLEICGARYTKKDMIFMEHQILESVNFQINKVVTTRELVLARLEEILGNNMGITNEMLDQNEGKQCVILLCEYILQLALVQYEFNLLSPNYFSAALLYISCKMKNVKGINSKGVITRYGLMDQTFKTHFFKIIGLYKSRNESKFREVNKKYNITDNYF